MVCLPKRGLSVLALCALCGSALAAPVSFTTIGTLAGAAGSRATAICADGQVVGGNTTSLAGNPAAFLFLVPGGTRLPIGGGATSVAALSGDGSRAVGAAGTRGYIFDQPMGPPVQPYNVSSTIAGVSADGQTTVGSLDGFGPFRRTGAADPVALETLDGFPDMTVAGCSADGLTAIGTAGRLEVGQPGLPDQIFYEAAKHVDGIGWVGLGTLDATLSPTESYANGVSADGTTVVGTSLIERPIPDSMDTVLIYTAFTHRGTTMSPLLSLAGELGFSEALDASADGLIVVGSGDGGSSSTGASATIWIGGAPVDVRTMLVEAFTSSGGDAGVLDGWSLTSCTAISDNGEWVAGEGLFNGTGLGWVAHRVDTGGGSLPCPLDYTPDGVVNPDDLGDFITDYFTAPPLPGPDGFAIACPGNDPPYDLGFKAAYNSSGDGQCGEPFPDNLGDFITDYFLLPEGFTCPTAR